MNDPVIHLQNEQFALFFRNNHFSVLYKTNGNVYVLVTDVGYCNTTSSTDMGSGSGCIGNNENNNPSPYRYSGIQAPFQVEVDRQDMEMVVWEHLSEVSG